MYIMELYPLAGMFTSMVMVVAIVWVVGRTRQRRLEIQAEVQTKLIDRFGTAPELVAFLHSPAGREFVSGVQSAPAVATKERIVSGISRAIVLICCGLSFFGMAAVVNVRGLMIPGLILFFLGVGFLISTFVSYRLSERLGLTAPYVPPSYAAPSYPAPATTTSSADRSQES